MKGHLAVAWSAFRPHFPFLAALVAWLPSSASALCLSPPGDVDGSGATNVVDVQCAIVTALWQVSGGATPAPACSIGNPLRTDANCDGVPTVGDVQIIVAYALGQTLSPAIDADSNGCPDTCDAPIDSDGDGVPDLQDCQPDDPNIYPGAAEICNGLDDDCDGVIDEGAGALCDDSDACTEDLCVPSAPSSCCTNTGGPGCPDNAACQNCVCAIDPFCCNTAWDGICRNEANDPGLCQGACNCGSALGAECAHPPVNCDDGTTCTADSCDPATGCINSPANCDDNNACTIDTCEVGPCEGGVVFGGRCYRGTAAEITWQQARMACEADGGVLAAASTAGRQGAIQQAASMVCNPGSHIWIGLTDELVEGSFGWLNGDPLTYTNWNFGEPNNVGDEDYTEMYPNGTWNDMAGFAVTSCFVCEVPESAAPPVCAHAPTTCDDGNPCTVDSCLPSAGCVTSPVSCDDNNACTADACVVQDCAGGASADGRCYQAVAAQSNWTTARDECAAMGKVLATIRSTSQNAAARQAANLACGGQAAWIGLTDELVEGAFGWVSGEPLDYTNWAPGEPNNLGGEDYAELLPNGQWNDLPNMLLNCFVCEAPAVIVAGGCENSPITCEDNNPCTSNACDPSTGCVFAVDGCDDSNACTVDSCVPAPASSCCSNSGGPGCPDNAACQNCVCGFDPFCCNTAWDGICVNEANDPGLCLAACNCGGSTALCTHEFVACDDGNPCTANSCDPATGCTSSPVDCNDNDACTTDTCVVQDCEDGASADGRCYQAVLADSTWTMARDECAAMGKVLATIRSAAQNTAARQAANLACGGQSAWIGLTDELSEGAFGWVSGEPVSYTNWAPGEPNNLGDEDFTEMLPGGQWNDLANAIRGCFICEQAAVVLGGGCENAPITCDDNNPCTSNSCDPAAGCFFPENGCDDGNACTMDSCNLASASACCTNTGGPGCPDNALCQNCVCGIDPFCCSTSWDGICVGEAADPSLCADACNCNSLATSCVHEPVPCDDGNPCTADGCDPGTGCFQIPQDCNDGNACTIDSCNVEPCAGGVVFDGRCYRATSVQSTWQEARTACEAANGVLAAASTGGRLTAIQQSASMACGTNTDIWLGLTDEMVEGSFGWLNGDPLTFTNWSPGEPNNLGGENYVEMYPNGLWNDLPATSVNDCFVCEVPVSAAPAGCAHMPIVCGGNGPCALAACDPATGCTTVSPCSDDNECTEDICTYSPPSSCCTNTGGPGCADNAACQNCVCPMDPFCCGTAWDGLCVNQANDPNLCASACNCGGNASATCSFPPVDCDDGNPCTADACLIGNPCCTTTGGPGCATNQACQNCVCGMDPFCCSTSWDNICVSEASSPDLCRSACECDSASFCNSAPIPGCTP